MTSPRKLFHPPSDLHSRKLPVTRRKGMVAYRVHTENLPAVFFGKNPIHRFSHPDAPENLLYLGEAKETCLSERFGESIIQGRLTLPRSQWEHTRMSEVEIRENLKLCDLTKPVALSQLGVDVGTLMQQDLAITQAWALAIQTHPDKVDGIRYASRFDYRACVALFERPRLAGKFRESSLGLLPEVDDANRFLAARKVFLV